MINRSLILLAPDAPASAAPATAPAVAATPAPAATAAASPQTAPAAAPSAEEDVLASLDAAYSKAGAPDGASAPNKPDAAAQAIAPHKPVSAAAPAPAKPVTETAGDKRAPQELRAELDRVKAEFTAHKQSTAILESKIKDHEAKGKDTEALHKRLEQRDKEFDALQSELRALKKEASPQFKEKYEKPFFQAANWAEEYVNKLKTTDGAQANFDRDFIPLYELARTTTIGQARARAVEIFGETEAIEVVDSVKELVRLDRLGAQALAEEKKGWKEKSEQEHGLLVQQQLSRTKQERELFDKVNQEFQNGIEAFRDLPEDKEASALRKTGYDQFEALISRTPKDVSQKLQWGAHVKQRFAAFEPNQLTIKRQADKIAALEAQIAGLKPATPGGGKITPTGGDGAGKADDSMDSWAKGAKTAVEAV